jgi:CDP-4-dehydro-6-deoxyglucose reductase
VASIVCDGRHVALTEGETVLEGLLRAGMAIPHACRAGACQSCLVRATTGTPPAASQVGLKETLRRQGYFLACAARPAEDLTVTTQDAAALAVPAAVQSVARLSPDVLRVRLVVDPSFSYEPGQFVTLLRSDGLARSYSIASQPDDEHLELHVRLVPGGLMSGWLAAPEALGAALQVRGPSGTCFYVKGRPEQPLLLAGTGTGLAPLWAIARAAIAAGHTGPIRLFHGARSAAGLYFADELRDLSESCDPFEYVPCTDGRVEAAVLERLPSLKDHRVFLCGNPDVVTLLRKKVFLAGASLKDIYADAFLPSAAPSPASNV